MKEEEADDDEARARFLREARLAASLDHPGIVEIYDVGSIDSVPYIAMEWIDGKPLRSLLDAPLEQRLDAVEAIAAIVVAAHEQGGIHRDLKPSNVLIDAHGAPRLLDFGIAKRTARAELPHPLTFETRDDVMLGTPSYMPPEQLASAARVDARADQFAWGVIAYELCSLSRDHEEATGDIHQRATHALPRREDLRCSCAARAAEPMPQMTLQVAIASLSVAPCRFVLWLHDAPARDERIYAVLHARYGITRCPRYRLSCAS